MKRFLKDFFKEIVVSILARQVHLLRKTHNIKVIGVVGGIGKTSAKMAIAEALGKTLRVRYEERRAGSQESNYNDIVSVPLVFFGHSMPSLFNPLAWTRLFLDNAKQIKGDYPFDVVIVELATNRPGHIAAFGRYLELDYAVVTAIVPEHMEYFDTMQAVANEELSVATYSKNLIYNADLVAEAYQQPLQAAVSYSMKQPADYRLVNVRQLMNGFEGDVAYDGEVFLHFHHNALSEIQLYPVLAAVTLGGELGLTPPQIQGGIATIEPVSGRLRPLRGINNSLIIDDTYNALPEAVKAGLKVVYGLKAPQKIVILGNMNEFGATSAQVHKEIGKLCDPNELDLVVTIGPDANAYLAPAAAAQGCDVKSFTTPYEAGAYLKSRVQHGAIVYAKGSQNKVFAEEAIKLLLADPNDASKLVRQSEYWQKRKARSFQ
ncbi:MAG TPA: Mur ligase family protein [Candidatus Saccharimonadales bacterium]|nr:Mur ligase family protein [Candidatus Saccharimonadales bacterium]